MHPDGRYSHVVVETQPEVLSDAQRVASFRPGVRLPTVVICSLIAALASVIGTYLTTHSAPADCASSGDMRTVNAHVDELNRTVSTLTATVNANADRESNHFAIINGTLLTIARAK